MACECPGASYKVDSADDMLQRELGPAYKDVSVALPARRSPARVGGLRPKPCASSPRNALVLPQYKDGKVDIPLVWKQEKLLIPDFIPDCCRDLKYVLSPARCADLFAACWTGPWFGCDAHLAACVSVRVRVAGPTSNGMSSGASTPR